MSLEKLHGLNFSEEKLLIKVTSTGCTEKIHFNVQKDQDDPKAISFIRNIPDKCKMAPHTVELAFNLKELGLNSLQNVFVRNPFSLGPAFVR
jgi:hypothetical protein